MAADHPTHAHPPPAAPQLVVVGSISTDRIHTPHTGPVDVLGGAGLYAALGAAAAGVRVGLVGVAGDTAAAAATVLAPSIDYRGVAVLPGPGPRFVIGYDTDWRGDYRVDGADAEAAIGYPMLAAAFPDPAWVHLCPTGPPAVQRHLCETVRAAGAATILSATTFHRRIRTDPAEVDAVWQMVDLFVCDLTELQLLTGTTDSDVAQHRARATGDRRVVCVTDGQRGAWLITAGTVRHIPAYRTRTVDPTGAGESYAGALAAGLLAGTDPQLAATTAAAIASLTVEDFGALRLSRADPTEITRRAAHLAQLTSAADAAVPAPTAGGAHG